MKRLIVARWNEDLNWLENLPSGWQPHVIYKDIDIPNVGREAASYFHALATVPYQARDTIAFCQGEPFEHSHHFFERLSGPVKRFTWLSDWKTTDDCYGAPNHPGIPLAETFERWYDRAPPAEFEFAAGAQFAITGTMAKRFTREFYARMRDTVMAEEATHKAPWCAERHWSYLW